MDKARLLKRFDGFCIGLQEKDRLAIIHHSDADGIASGAIAARAIFKLTGKKPVFVSELNYGGIRKEIEIAEALKKKRANKLVFLDMGIDSPEENEKRIKGLEQVVIIDHHPFKKDLNSEKVIFLNAKYFSKLPPSNYPAAKLTFDLFSRNIDLGEAAWIACIGIIGDKGLETWKDFITKTAKRNKTNIAELKNLEKLVSAVSVVNKKDIPELFWALFKAKSPRDLRKNNFLESLRTFEEEKKILIKNIDIEAKCFEALDLRIYKIKTRFSAIKSQVVNELSEQMPDKTIIVAEWKNSNVKFSARRKDFKVDMGKLLKAAVKGISGARAGGHIPAAAGSVQEEHYKKFEEQLKEELEKQKK